jgi:hypothetical protein
MSAAKTFHRSPLYVDGCPAVPLPRLNRLRIPPQALH